MYDVLPSPTNLATWRLTEESNCVLCGKPANLEHILSACSEFLKDGRYTWRHDKVLAVLADTLERYVKTPRATKGGLKFVNFVKEGETGPRAGVEGNGLLGTATDWKMRVDGVPIRNSSNEQEARYCHLVGENKAGSATGTDCTLGREN